MKNALKRLQKKAGFISLETIIVTGVVIALGIYGLNQYNVSGKVVMDASIDKVNEILSFDL